MSSRRHQGAHELEAEDAVFQPRSSFDFDDDLSHHGHHLPTYKTFAGADMDFNMESGFDEGLDAEFFHDQNAHMDLNGGSKIDFHAPVDPPSKQSNIVSSRNGQVAQVFGQITPPEDIVPNPFKIPAAKPLNSREPQSQDGGKLSNEQRARNAANTRHSRTKNSSTTTTKKKASKGGDVKSETETQKQKILSLQREKNRIAAAKCRAKKKTANEQQEEMANEFSATNNLLTREIRDLKNQKSELQNYLLAHRPGVCECHGIHDYNMGQAQRLVLNARRHANVPSTGSPSQQSASAQSSASDAMMFSRPSPLTPAEIMSVHSSAQSFNSPMDFGFNPNEEQDEDERQEMHREFAEFLQSSPGGGRAGFS